jgi:hypothetical protein
MVAMRRPPMVESEEMHREIYCVAMAARPPRNTNF